MTPEGWAVGNGRLGSKAQHDHNDSTRRDDTNQSVSDASPGEGLLTHPPKEKAINSQCSWRTDQQRRQKLPTPTADPRTKNDFFGNDLRHVKSAQHSKSSEDQPNEDLQSDYGSLTLWVAGKFPKRFRFGSNSKFRSFGAGLK